MDFMSGKKLGFGCMRLPVLEAGKPDSFDYLFRYSSFFGHAIIWWNGLFGFGMGFLISWTYYISGWWQRNSAITTG